ncbi:MAG: hypothetical protein PVH00_04230 [Gemmatimonadota bacterium]|jgi:hypothetical protein
MGEPRPGPEAGSSSRTFDVEGEPWIAEVAGAAAVGGAADSVIECLHFRRENAPEGTSLRIYLPRGRFTDLDDAELRELRSAAVPIQPPTVYDATQDPESPPGRKRAVVEYPERDDG